MSYIRNNVRCLPLKLTEKLIHTLFLPYYQRKDNKKSSKLFYINKLSARISLSFDVETYMLGYMLSIGSLR